ncbi:hypothetical protein CHS0354_011422 [Potamilus streckersoni]|uniref:Uncharacterized protein n=1 Tax=Potamilus streckersoni TaxID=2493646 RepID=A0AAE0TH09_9BIVA|nr:hypothetical protein CHS0354_011422 [Potamilus streckersoni]
MASLILLLTALFPLTAKCFFFQEPNWNNLRVTWGKNPLSHTNFASMPRTEENAIQKGFVMKSNCNASRNFAGKRYWKDNDPSVMLLYDVNGYIAGIQIGITKDMKTGSGENYPFERQVNAPFVDDGDFYVITAYFIDPAIVCTIGRTQSEFSSQGTGEYLRIQNGTHPTDVITVPTRENEVENTGWTQGKCFPSMGVHYWNNLHVDMPCNELFPVFLLYNKGNLNAFGWALQTNVPGTQRLEHPPPSSYSLFMKTVPSCLYRQGTLTTLHMYLTTNYFLNLC